MNEYIPADSLRGFGSADVTTPFHYGSVADGLLQEPSLEQKLKKKYWKTKQTVMQKLGKDQDEFVVAGDSDIDIKLEKAYHLKSSCQELLNILAKYSSRMKTSASCERAMGEYLSAYSELEYTNAGEVMQNVGKLQQAQAKERLIVVPSLQRMQYDFATFMHSAIRDLAQSIQTLEKSRTEYRAALLWMRDVSEKLQNPDYRDQLSKFREAQAAVKGARTRFEKLKTDLSEKIEMVSASRCNLLSRCLPYYQKGVLSQLDKAADAYHQVLAELRTHHNHQYKVKKIMEEIHHLETEDELQHGIISPEVGSEASAPSLGSVEESAGSTPDARDEDDDEPLIDIGQSAGAQEGEGQSAAGARGGEEPSEDDPERKAGELDLLGDLGDFAQQPQCPSAADELNDLLQLELPMEQAEAERSTQQKSPADQLFDEWSTFSAFMPATKPDGDPPTSGASDWEEEFRQTGPPPEPLLGFELEQLQNQDGSAAAGGSIGSVPTDKQPAPSAEGFAPGDSLLLPTAEPRKEGSETTLPSTQPSEAGGLDDLLPVPPSGRKQSDSLEKPTSPDEANKPASSASGATALSDDLMFLDLGSPPAAPGKEGGAATTGLESLDPALFQRQFTLPASQISTATPPSMQAPLIPTPDTTAQQLIAGSTMPPSIMQLSTHHPMAGPTSLPAFRSPLTTSQGPILPPQPMPMRGLGGQFGSGGVAGGSTMGAGAAQPPGGRPAPKEKQPGDKSDKKGTSWMNVFAHLDPLVNEKA